MLQDTFRQLLANGQVEFVSGGWSMHDEALVGARAAAPSLSPKAPPLIARLTI